MGQFFLGESQSRLYPHMRVKFGRGPTVVSKKARLTLIIDSCSLLKDKTSLVRIFKNVDFRASIATRIIS